MDEDQHKGDIKHVPHVKARIPGSRRVAAYSLGTSAEIARAPRAQAVQKPPK
jgi:hypothetical protein